MEDLRCDMAKKPRAPEERWQSTHSNAPPGNPYFAVEADLKISAQEEGEDCPAMMMQVRQKRGRMPLKKHKLG